MQRFFATCPKGLEYLLRDELVALGAQAREALAGVHFEGTLETAYRACLWSRLASRILMPLAEFEAPDGEALYRGVAAVDWAQHFGVGARFAIDAHGSTRGITHSLYAVQRSKDAIVDQFRQRDGTRPEVDTEHPDLRLDLVLRRERAILSLDLSGAPLHQRGWRQGTGKAPLKENLAAAILLRARWPEVHAAGGALVDPLGIRDKSEGVAFRATFIVDPDNIIQHVSVNNFNVGRSPEETLRVLDALLTEDLCACNRPIGGGTL